MARITPQPAPKPLSVAANLSNLLPTGTVLAFQALIPSFSNNGSCLASNKYLTLSMIVVFSVVCFISSFTDSVIGDDGKHYNGIATTSGLYIFNYEDDKKNNDEENNHSENNINENDVEMGCFCRKDKKRQIDSSQPLLKAGQYRIRFRDYVHAFSSLLLFLVFAISSTDVQRCFFPHARDNENRLMINLPLGVGVLVSFLFMLFPTTRRGIGFADSGAQTPKNGNPHP